MFKNHANYGRVVTLAVIFFGLIIGSCWLQGPAFASAGKAYIVIGDIEPAWYSTLLRSAFGEVNVRQDLDPVIQAQANKMRDLGYEVEFIEIGLTTDIERIIKDPATKALAWFGHGDPNVSGTVATYDGDITPGDIKEWAQEKLAEKIGWPQSWKGLPEAERRENMELRQDAHFDFEYAYFHTCYSLASNKLSDVLMADNGRFYGYLEKAYLSDNSVLATEIRGKTVSETEGGIPDSWDDIDWDEIEGISDLDAIDWDEEIEVYETPGGSGGPGSGIYPAEPFNGMQIIYNISGASITDSADSSGFTTERTLSGKLGTGQLHVSGSASITSGWGAHLNVTVNVDGVNENHKAYLETPCHGYSFDVSVPIPAGAGEGSFSISMTGIYNAGERGLVVGGSLSGNPPPNGYNQINVLVNDSWIDFDVPPVIEDGRTLVPVRKIADALGCTTKWIPPGAVSVDRGNTHIDLKINNKTAYVNGRAYTLDVPPRIIGNRTLLPLRFLSESLGLQVGWDNNTKVITINQ